MHLRVAAGVIWILAGSVIAAVQTPTSHPDMTRPISALAIPSITVPTTSHVLIDARCDGDEWETASRTPIGEIGTLLLQQDTRYIYACVPLPPDSYGTMDFYVLPASDSQPTNLHASAQVGERQRTSDGWPEWTFGKYQGWYSPPVALSASTVTDGRARLTFDAVGAREIAIDKSKFGSSRWEFMIEIRALGSNKNGSLRFPITASPDSPATWATLDHSAGGLVPPSMGTETIAIDSTNLGQTRSVWIAAPAACRESITCDLLVVLDAHALFPLATNYAALMQTMGRMAPLVIVGIPSRTPAERLAQFTPAPSDDERTRYPNAGGAPNFLRFLEEEVVPRVTARHRVSTRKALIGHSLAGLLTVEALTSGGPFESYAALSPTLGWNGQRSIETLKQRFNDTSAPERRLYVSVAGGDTAAYLDAFAQLESSLAHKTPPWLRTQLRRFADDDHVTTIGPSLTAAMNWLFVHSPTIVR